MSEAKDWAGELISGQTGTGRILVSFAIFQNVIFIHKLFEFFIKIQSLFIVKLLVQVLVLGWS